MIRHLLIGACVVGPLVSLSTAAAPPPLRIDAFTEQEVLDTVNHSGSFGAAVALDSTNTLALVGAPLDPYGKGIEQGGVFAYGYSNGSWQLTQQLVPSSDQDGGSFGFSIAISGTTAIIGAYTFGTLYFGGQPSVGKAYIFNYANGVWTRAAELMATDADALQQFGFSVAIDGNTALIGAPAFGSTPGEPGSAYVFRKNAFGLWLQSQKLTSSTDQTLNGEFGRSVALAGDQAAIGQMRSFGGSGGSIIYFFTQSGNTWTQSQTITPVSGGEAATALAMTSTVLIAGAPAYAVNGNANQGGAYVYRRVGSTWGLDQTLTASNGHAGDQFGRSVAIHEPQVVVGAPSATILGATWRGAAYYFTEVNGQFDAGTRIVASNGVASDFFGTSVALSGSWNPSYLIGARGVRKSGILVGAAYFYWEP